MKLSQYKGHTYDIPHIQDYFGYKTEFFKKYGLATDDVTAGPQVFTNYGGYKGNGNPLQCSCLENPREG